MDNGSLWIVLAVVIVAVIAGNIISGFIQIKGTFDQKDLIDKIEKLSQTYGILKNNNFYGEYWIAGKNFQFVANFLLNLFKLIQQTIDIFS